MQLRVNLLFLCSTLPYLSTLLSLNFPSAYVSYVIFNSDQLCFLYYMVLIGLTHDIIIDKWINTSFLYLQIKFFKVSSTWIGESIWWTDTLFYVKDKFMSSWGVAPNLIWILWFVGKREYLLINNDKNVSGDNPPKTYLCNISRQSCALLWSSGRDNEICNWQW